MFVRVSIFFVVLLSGAQQELFSRNLNKVQLVESRSCEQQKASKVKVRVHEQPKFRKDGLLSFYKQQDKHKDMSQDGPKRQTKIIDIDIEIAEDGHAGQQGLMYRDSMSPTAGMLFLFNDEALRSFYMKNTIIPLDIIFVNTQKKIVSIQKNATPYSLKILPSGKPARYAVEVNAGFCEKHGIAVGDSISFKRV